MRELTRPGRLAEDIRSIDWSQTALGPIETWPERLRTVVELVLYSATAACLFWGEDGLMFYNDAWAATFISLPPALLGRPAAWLSHDLHARYLTRLERMEAGEAGELFDTLKLFGACDLSTSATCTPVVGETGVGQGMLVQLGPGSPRPASTLGLGPERPREHRSTFMLHLIDGLGRLEDPMEIQAAAAGMLRDYLGADRAGFCQIDIDKGVARLRTDFRRADGVPMRIDDYDLGEFAQDVARLRAGQSLAEGDRPRAGKRFLDLAARSQVSVPVLCSGRLMAAVTLGQGHPRDWSVEEISIAQEAACRAWEAVERSRADAAHRASKQVEADLHHAETRLRLAQEAAGVGTFDWIINSNEGHWSPELMNILGLQPGEFGGTYEDWIATIHPEDLPRAVSAIEIALESGVLEGDWRVVRPDGTVLYVLARGLVERDANDRPQRLTGAQVDITERRRNEQQVQFLLAELDDRIEDLNRELRDRGI
ncbi:PAS domain-containing protein [Solirhodobacter olei]|uniref:PAS domain-containing protein n=1 Tax=Solirhodobacter olei TaxID=2493082 RepID=UPI000FD76490|nr:PAS domain-containing protein [Solirhodobacter olei]